jgi:hypothetical protein
MMQIDVVADETIVNITGSDNKLAGIFFKLIYSIDAQGITAIFAVVLIYCIYRYSYSLAKCKTEEIILGILMALTYIFGRAFNEFGSTAILAAGIVQIIKTFFILVGVSILPPQCIKVIRNCVGNNFVFEKGFDIDNPVKYRRIVFGIMLLIWFIYLVAYFPGLFMGDTEDIIHMSYNYPTGLENTVVLLSPDVYIVDHHSILYTVILGFFVRMGRFIFSSENIGIFIYTICQELFTAWVLAYSLYKLKCNNVNSGIRTVILLFFCLFPWIPQYAIMATKDTLFADFMILYILNVMDVVSDGEKKIKVKNIAVLSIYAVIIFLLRKNGLYMIILSLPFMLMINRKWIKEILIIIVCIFAVKFVYSDIILPVAKIPDGSVSAALSIPLQQTSRYLTYYGDEVTDEEKEAIERVADYEALATTYWADRSDRAKAAWKKEADSDDIKAYFAVWAKMLIKHPLTYVAATANNYYAYFYPTVIDMYEFERSSDAAIESTNAYGYFNFKASDSALSMFARSIIKIYNTLLMRLPVVNILCTSALYIWILIFTWSRAMIKRDRKLLMLVIPMLMLMLTILSGPCNGNIYHRFTYPVAMAMPIIAGYGFRKEIKSE